VTTEGYFGHSLYGPQLKSLVCFDNRVYHRSRWIDDPQSLGTENSRTHVPLFGLKPLILVIKRTHVPLFSHLVAFLTRFKVNRGAGVRKSEDVDVFLLNRGLCVRLLND
jgi:hypothetical protein